MASLADLFRRHGPDLLRGGLAPAAQKAVTAICRCRTPALGGHRYRCTGCGRDHFAFHSCNHRLCPNCGALDTAEWCEREEKKRLPVPYFLITVTLPDPLRRLCRRHPAILLPMLVREAAGAIEDVARSRLGGEPGMLAVLHTWTRDLRYHPHAHFVVPGGVWTGSRWIRPTDPGFFLPARVLSRRVRTRMRGALERAGFAPALKRQEWVVHCQPAGSGVTALRYLARYLFRAPIRDERILREADGQVTFAYTYSATRTQRTVTLPVDAFLRRVLDHALPKGLHRIRRFGWLHPRAKSRLRAIQAALHAALRLADSRPSVARMACPHCGCTALIRTGTIPRARFDTS